MTVRVALQGVVRTFNDVLMGATVMLVLEPPPLHRSRSRGRFVTREYRPIRYDAATDTATCVGAREYWM